MNISILSLSVHIFSRFLQFHSGGVNYAIYFTLKHRFCCLILLFLYKLLPREKKIFKKQENPSYVLNDCASCNITNVPRIPSNINKAKRNKENESTALIVQPMSRWRDSIQSRPSEWMVRKCPLAPIWRICTHFSPHLPWLLNDECVWRMIYPLYLCGPAIKETKINLVNRGRSFVCE